MEPVRSSIVAIAVLWVAIGCASTQPTESNTITLRDKGELVYLFCDNRVMAGETTPRRVCWEPTETEALVPHEDKMILYCEHQTPADGDGRACREVKDAECEISPSVGTRIAKLSCMSTTDKKLQEIQARIELERFLK